MASSRWPTTQLVSHEFVNCAGSVLFSHKPGGPLQVCFLHHTTGDEWMLPKGRQDLGESLSEAAVRETFEETGYACELLPVTMITRAPETGQDMKDFPVSFTTAPNRSPSVCGMYPTAISSSFGGLSLSFHPARREGTTPKCPAKISSPCSGT